MQRLIFSFLTVCCLWALGGVSTAHAVCVKSNVFLLLDVSGSMKDTSTSTKHTDVRTAIKKFTYDFRSKVRFGLATFGTTYTHKVNISDTAWSTIRSNVDSYPSNQGYTKMGTAISNAGAYLWNLKQNEVGDGRKRRYYIVLITDGNPTGDTLNPTTETTKVWQNYGIKTYAIGIQFNATVLNSIATAGQTSKPYNANSQSSITSAFNAIANTATTEVCNNVDDDCDGSIDEFLVRPCTTSCGFGIETCSRGVWANCTASQPKAETCNDKDDDCDGRVDENWSNKGNSCSAGAGGCQRTGKYVCNQSGTGTQCSVSSAQPTSEKCDGLDNDCDGRVDESLVRNCSTACGSGTEICSNGRWIGCSAPKPQAEKCNGKDDDCDGRIDENWSQKNRSCTTGVGECKRSGSYRCKADGSGLECSTLSGPPSTEICDGKDNDCDGQTDEDFPKKGQTCGSGVGACSKKGTYICTPNGLSVQCSAGSGQPEPEKCDGTDNDCDGIVDEGLQRSCSTKCGTGLESCNNGKWVNCSARKEAKETCNGKDDDCDGTVDNGLTRKCTSKCGDGQETCNNGRWEGCTAQQPKNEECNGKDDDCNGRVDDLVPKKCSGACGSGTATCDNGKWSGCSGPQPEPETCDGKDNDCNGKIDDGVSRRCKSICGEGKEYCEAGNWSACDAPLPQPEFCDGKDNNCNGKIDESAVCPSGTVCSEGACRPECSGGECPKGLQCVKGVCVGDACATAKCADGEVCMGGRCVEPCSLVTCDSGLRCSNGQCVREDCYFTGCSNGKSCVKGRCVADPCAGKTCGADEFCREGDCVKSCANVTCGADERCVDGKCEVNPSTSGDCANKTCPAEQICSGGNCVADPCYGVSCAQGRMCVNGNCEHDPCTNVKCPANQECVEGQCQKPGTGKPKDDGNNPSDGVVSDGGNNGPDGTVIDQGTGPKNVDAGNGGVDETNRRRVTGGVGGCACSTKDGGLPMTPFIFGLFFLVFAIRRRR